MFPRSLPLVVSLTVACGLWSGAGAARAGEAAPPTAPPEPPPAAAAAGAPAAAGSSDPVPLPRAVQQGLEDAVKAKITTLVAEKNDLGIPYKRASYSRQFRPREDGSYQTILHVDTATAPQMKTERFLLTLRKDASGTAWTIAEQTLQDTYADVYRDVFDNKHFRAFESVAFDREGFKVTGGKGALYETLRNGKISGFVLRAENLAWTYNPPMSLHQKLYAKVQRDHPGQMSFVPDTLEVDCDAGSCEELLASIVRTPAGAGSTEVEGAAVPAGTRDDYDYAVKQDEKDRRDDWFSGFRSDTAGHRYWGVALVKGRFHAGEPGKAVMLRFNDWEPREVSFWAYGFFRSFPGWDPLYRYYSEATRARKLDPTELERRDDPEGRDYDLQGLKGTVAMAETDSETMTGDITYTLRLKRPVKRLYFLIARLKPLREDRQESKSPRMFVNSIQDGQGRDLTFVKLSGYGGLVVLPEELPAGAMLTLRAQFENRDAIYKLNPSFSYLSRGGWLPFVRFGDMIQNFELVTKVPEKYTTLGIGRKVSEEVVNGMRVTRWAADKPVDFPTVIFGDYINFNSKVQAKKSDGSPIAVAAHMDKSAAGITYFEASYNPASEKWDFIEHTMPLKAAQNFADEAANALNLYSAIFGVDYPYAKLDLVNDPLGGLYGQAPASIVYLGQVGFLSEGALGSMGGGDLPKFTKSLVAHETAHQWWGGVVGNANSHNYWFVESLAEYSSALFLENVYGRKDYLDHVAEWRRRILETDMQVSVQEASEVWGGDDFGAYQAAVYAKGPYAFHILRSTFGDEKFFAFLKALAQELKEKEIVTRDIQRVSEKAFGGTMEWFFDQWLRGVGIPEFSIQHTVTPTEDGKYVVSGEVTQRLLFGAKKEELTGEYFRGIVPITCTGKDGKELRYPLRVEGAKTQFKFKVPGPPADVQINKYGEALAYDIKKAS